MKIRSCELVISAAGESQFPDDGLPEVALAGRSNVGKSSLINRMLMRRNLARTSAQPGKTQTLNFYRINQALYFVDFPGYGYARVSVARRQEWGRLAERYLRKRKNLKLVLHLVDLRHPPTADDQNMFAWLLHYRIPVCVVATKADKISRGQIPKHVRIVRETLEMPDHVPLVVFSSETGQGRDELWRIIAQAAEIPADGPSEPPKVTLERENKG